MVINTAEPSKNTYYSDENQKKIDNFNSKVLNKQNIKKLEITTGYKKDDQYIGIDELTLNFFFAEVFSTAKLISFTVVGNCI